MDLDSFRSYKLSEGVMTMVDVPEWMRKAQVGDKVICVFDFSASPKEAYLKIPIMHGTYTIREICIGVASDGEKLPGFTFKEIVNPPEPGGEMMFCYDGFRPSEPHAKAMDQLRKIASDPKKYGVPLPTAKEIFLQVI